MRNVWASTDFGPSMTRLFIQNIHPFVLLWWLIMMKMSKCLSMNQQLGKGNHKFKSMLITTMDQEFSTLPSKPKQLLKQSKV